VNPCRHHPPHIRILFLQIIPHPAPGMPCPALPQRLTQHAFRRRFRGAGGRGNNRDFFYTPTPLFRSPANLPRIPLLI